MGTRGKTLGLIWATLLLALAGGASAEICRDDVVLLRGEAGTARFRVEVADDAAEQAQGLMNRETLAQSAGMLFVYPEPKRVAFWMKNTLIPLDMVFLDASGTVQKVHHEARPLDETPIFGGNAIQSVLEINGGLAREIGITEGWALRHPSIDQGAAAWPCEVGQ